MTRSNDARRAPHPRVRVSPMLASAVAPGLVPIGDALGRVLTQRADIGRMAVTLGGQSVLANTELSHSGSFSYAGDPEWFSGELTITFSSGYGAELILRAQGIGRHLDARSAAIHCVGTFEAGASMPWHLRRLGGQIAVAEITVADLVTYRARFHRLVPTGPARNVPNVYLRAHAGGTAVH